MTSPDRGSLSASAVDTLGRVALIANESRTADTAVKRTLTLLTAYFGGTSGQAWRVSEAGEVGAVIATHGPDTGTDRPLAADLNATTVVAQVCESGPVWLHGGRVWTGARPAAQAPASGDGATWGAAFPVLVADTPVAVLAVAGASAIPADVVDSGLVLMRLVGAELGHVLWRERDRARDGAHTRALEAEIARRTEELVSARNSAVAADRARSAFLTAISHDLRTPIHSCLAAAQIAASEPAGDHAALLATVQASAEELLERLDEIVALAKPKPQEQLHPVPARVPTVLAHALSAYDDVLADSLSAVNVEFDPSLDHEVLLQKAGFLRVIDALFAFFMTVRDGGRIALSLGFADNLLYLHIAGCPDPSERSAWSLVSQAVESVHGTIDSSGADSSGADSDAADTEEVDTGQVRITIPAVRTGVRRTGRSNRVLLVDDTAVTRHLGEAMIRSLGYTVDCADGGLTAIAAVHDQAYGLVLMDLRMPDMDGMAATRAIRAGHAGEVNIDVPVVALTADVVPGVREHALLAGMDDFVTKPFSKDTLGTLLGRFIPLAG